MPYRTNTRKGRPRHAQHHYGGHHHSTHQLYQLLGLVAPDDEEVAEVSILIEEIIGRSHCDGATGLFTPKEKSDSSSDE